MGKGKGNKARQRARFRAKRNNQRQVSHVAANNQDSAHDQVQASRVNMTPDEEPDTSLRGGHIDLAVHRGTLTFNPSTINAHDEGDQDVTLLDISPTKTEDTYNPLFGEVSTVESRGINIFKIQSEPVRLTTGDTETDADVQRSLEDVFADNPDSRLPSFDGETLAFAGRAVKQVVLEATYGFLQNCFPQGEQQRLWDEIRGGDKGKPTAKYSISIPDGTMDLKNGVRSISDLIGNCIDILSQDTPVTDQKSLQLCLNRAVTLCDALGDESRKQALGKTTDELNWLIVGLDCKNMELYRLANRQLDKVNMSCHVTAEKNGESGAPVRVNGERQGEERKVLQSMQREHEGFRQSFRVRFIEKLQNLLAL